MSRSISRFCLVGIFIIFISLISGTYALWRYAELPAAPRKDIVDIFLNAFGYAPEEVVPGEEGAAIGENHLQLIDMILNEDSYGLNAEKNRSCTPISQAKASCTATSRYRAAT